MEPSRHLYFSIAGFSGVRIDLKGPNSVLTKLLEPSLSTGRVRFVVKAAF
jgi:hypothetical protein